MKLFLLLLFPIFCFSQQIDNMSTYNSLILQSDNYINVDFKKSLMFAEKALAEKEIENDSERRAQAYYYAAKSLVFFRNFEKSSQYIEKGLQEDALKTNIQLKALFLMLQSAYYGRMSLFEQAFRNNQEVLALLESRNDLESRLLVPSILIYIADYYTEMKDYESAHLYADRSIAAIERIPVQQYLSAKRIYQNKAFIYFYKSWILLEQKKPHLAYPFIQKAYNQAMLEKIEYLALFYETYGDYYYQINDDKKAIDFYLKAIENKEKFGQYPANVDSKIARSYKILRDDKNEVYYIKRAESRRKIDQDEYNKTIQKELNRISTKENIEKANIKLKNHAITGILIIIFILLLVFIIIRYQKIRKKKREIIGKQKIKLSEKEFKIKEREVEIEKLQRKVNESFSELSEVAIYLNAPNNS